MASHQVASTGEDKRQTARTHTIDKTTSLLPAKVHVTVQPHVHEIEHREIYREIHTRDVIHRVQPVVETTILPPRHFLRSSDGKLVEISAEDPKESVEKSNPETQSGQ